MTLRLHHIGLSVMDLSRSIDFYRQHLGMQVISERTFGGGQYEIIMGLEGAAGRSAMLRSDSFQLELFEFARPRPGPSDPARPVCDHGITHFCVEVSDLEAEYARMKAAGVRFHCPPLHFAGKAWATYARDPDGNVVEILQRISIPPE